jgi:D-glycero-D-manno-heptose 1,7-bisphosphate phosphatase
MSRPAVFLDRDGVLNETWIDESGVSHPPSTVENLRLLAGVREGCRALRDAGYLLLVVTNQPDVARGVTTREAVDEINHRIAQEIPLDGVLVCYHDDADGCSCRKPQPGLLLDAALRWDIALPVSVLIGDRWQDVEAGRRAGCATILVTQDRRSATPCQPDIRANSLPAAADWILHDMHLHLRGKLG